MGGCGWYSQRLLSLNPTTVMVVVVVVVVAVTAGPSAMQNVGVLELGGKITVPWPGQSARVHMVEGIGLLITTIHIGDRYLSSPILERHDARTLSDH